MERSDIHSRIRLESLQNQTDDYWGYMWAELQLPYAELINSMSLASLARMEMATIEKLIRWALPTSTWRG